MTRYETFNKIEELLRSAIGGLREAKKFDSEYEAAEAHSLYRAAEISDQKCGEEICKVCDYLRSAKTLVNNYLDEDEFFNTERI